MRGAPVQAQNSSFNFSPSGLKGADLNNPTSLQFGPDKRLYVSQQNGIIKAFTIQRNAANDYVVTDTEVLNHINQIPNHEDDGTPAPVISHRQVTGILVAGTAANPVLYVSSSDSRIGGPDGDKNLDTNSGIITRLTKSGSSWTQVNLVRGLPRSEENHAVNGMQLDEVTNTLFLAVGGSTNAGAPSTNFAYITEYALSAAILAINLTDIENLPTKGSGANAYKYDLPTVDDPTRANNPDGSDVNDPFGGNDGLNQAKLVPGGPVQVYSPGYRNPYDLVITRTPGRAGHMYTIDNGANQGWGGHPDNEGTTGQTTNNYVAGEPGSFSPGPNDPQVNNLDNLHYIGNIGSYIPGSYYGGHPTPIRANPNGAGLYTHNGSTGVWRTGKTGTHPLPADWPPVPLSAANPVEGDYRSPGPGNGALLTFYSSTNGLTEYRASNFNNALKGTLLAAGFNGDIYKIIPTADGTGVSNKIATWSPNRVNDEPSFASGFGANPLDLTAQGDEDIFPGTVWAATYGANAITVFEPQDMVVCSGSYSLTLDEDGDGYKNADELDNLTDPCSASSKPKDFDGDLLSDLNDPDDDNDGLADKADYFALDAKNGLATSLPVRYELFNNYPGTGLFGLGFTGLMSNGSTNYADQFTEGNLIAGGAVGAFSVVEVPAGDALGALNNQKNGFQFGINVSASQGPFTVQGRMVGPFFNNNATPQNFRSQGIYIGTGDQDNYLKITLNANNGQGGIEVVHEQGGVASTYQYPLTGGKLPGTSVDLYLSVDPVAGTVQPRYAQDGGAVSSLGSPIAVSGQLLTAIQSDPALAVGVVSTSRATTVFTATWDFVRVTADPVTAAGAWQTINPVNTPPAGSSENGYVQAGDKFYLIGGRGSKAVQAYDPVNKTWEAKADAPQVLQDFQAVTLNGLIYVAGAFSGEYPHEGPVPSVYIYNPATDKWTTGATIPQDRRRGAAAMVTHNNKIYLVGGIQDGHWAGAVPWLDEFNPATGSWQALADAPRARDHFQAAVVDGRIYLAGGRRTSASTGQPTSLTVPEVDVFDLATGQWSTLPATANVPVSRAGAAVAVLGEELLLIGGENAQGYALYETQALNVNTQTWRPLASLQQGRYGTQAIVNNNGVYLAGGSQGGGQALSTQEVFYMFAPAAPALSSLTASSLAGPASLDFGAIATGGSSSKEVVLSNTGGNQSIVVTSIGWTGSFPGMMITPGTPFEIAAGKSERFTIAFTPNTAGQYAANLTVKHSGVGQALSINLSGSGIDLGLAASPDKLHFFTQQSGTTSDAQLITVTNNGGTEKIVSSLTITGANSSQFNYSTNGSLTLAPGASLQVQVSFSPTSLGTKVAQLEIADGEGDSKLVIGLTGEAHDNPVVLAAHRINAGGDQNNTSRGVFAVDKYFTKVPGYSFTTNRSIAATNDDILYQSERSSAEDNGNFSYAMPVSNGQYKVVLHFAEIYWNNIGQRVFDVKAEGNLVLDDFDIIGKAGANFTATTETFSVEVSDGNLDLFFSALASEGGVNRPKVSAIEVIPVENVNLLPVADAGADQTITLPTSSLVLQGQGSDTDGTIQAYEWQQVSGPNTASFSSATEANPTVSQLIAGSYVFSLSVKDDKQAASTADQVTITVHPDPNASTVAAVYRINAGGPQITNSLGTFAADNYFTPAPGATCTVETAIDRTDYDAMYQSERIPTEDNGSFSYAFPVSNGPYTVVLHFAELQMNQAGKRIFDVKAEGALVLDDYDVVGRTQQIFRAISETFTVNVTDGSLDLLFSAFAHEGGVNRPKVSAIEVIPANGSNQLPVANAGADQTLMLPTSSLVLQGQGSDADGTVQSYAWHQVSGPTNVSFSSATVANPTVSGLKEGSYVFSLSVKDDQLAYSAADQVTVTVKPDPNAVAAAYRINAGGPQLTNGLGVFAADNYFTAPGAVCTVETAIDRTEYDAIYQSERISAEDNGSFSYAFPVSNGPYTVVLHFAELQMNQAGKRIFDVKAEGALVLDDYDVVGRTQQIFRAISETFTVNVTDGSLDLLFSAFAHEGGVNRPKVSAIEVIPADGSNQLPVANAGADQTLMLPTSSLVLQGQGSDADGTVQSYAWHQVSGPTNASFSAATVANPTLSGLKEGNYVFSLSVKDDQLAYSAADQVTVTVKPDPNAQVVAIHRINAGGDEAYTGMGTFVADRHFTGAAYVNTVTSPIAGTSDDALYQSERFSATDNGSFGYTLPVSNGQYTVVLHFAEVYMNAIGQRVFDVKAEGALVLDNFDIFNKAGGKNTATTETFEVSVTDGKLDLLFSALASEGGVNRPKVSAIEVVAITNGNLVPMANAGADQTITLPAGSLVLQGQGSDFDGTISSYAWQQVSGPNAASFSSATVANPTVSGLKEGSYVFSLTVKDNEQAQSTADQVTVTVNPDPNAPVVAVHRINAGGGQVSTSIGTFSADSHFTGEAYVNTVNNPIAGTANDAIYQSERFSATDNGSFGYAMPVDNGLYTVVLHFAEVYMNTIGQRVFDVKAEGALVLDNFDIISKAGGKNTATTEKFVVSVTDGKLDLLFSALASEGGVNRPKVSAIEVIAASSNNQLPVADAGADQTLTLPASSVVLQGAGSDADGTVQSYAWQQVSGPNNASFSSATVASPTVSGLVAGSYVFSLTVKDNGQAFSVADLVTVTVNGAQAAAYRINAGGSQVSNSIGTFAADSHFTGASYVNTSSNPIDATTDDAIYQSERFSATDNGSFGYAMPVDNGQYTVVLHFAELYHNWYGKRVFDVKAEGALVLDNYDIYGKTHENYTATTETFVVEVADGTLDLLFSALASEGGVDRPKVSAIEVIPYQGNAAMRQAATTALPQEKPDTDAGLVVTAYPNPFQQQINLKMEGAAAGTYTVRVLDLLGRKLYQASFTAGSGSEPAHTIDLSATTLRSGGVYLVEVEQVGGPMRKVIKVLKD